MSGNRKDRSRSPMRAGNVGRRRDKDKVAGGNVDMQGNNMMAQQMMMSNLYPQGNMMMPGGMYQNMMMPNMMGGGMMPSTGIEMMQGGNIDMIAPAPMDMSGLNTAAAMGAAPRNMEMGMMGGMMMDPSIMGNMGMYQGGEMVEKKEINLKHCKLIPPDPGSDDPPRRPKPPGCRTIFVGGLPDNITEKIVREIFENYGRIHILRLSTKNFCHIRFDKESCVEPAMSLSGYRIKLLNKDGEEEDNSKANSGKLHVDYALSRDDQNEFERRQRQVMRAQEVQMQQITAQQQALQMATEGSAYGRSPSPPRVLTFTNASISQLAERIKSEEQFAISLPTLIAWLERGECSKKNSNQFYSMIQATNSHIRRLFNEKMQSEEELVECRERVKNNIASVIDQLEQVAKVFAAATHQRVWDHFTKPQRKNIETWQKMSQEFCTLKEEFNEKFYGNTEEDINNGYNNMNITAKAITMDESDDVKRLKLENDSLKFQLEAYKNEIDVIKTESQKEFEKFKAQFIARQALKGAFETKPPLPTPVSKPPPPPPLPEDLDAKVNVKECIDPGCGEAKLIGVMSAFLQVHPQGASLDYVVSYVRALFPQISQASVHQVLQKHEDVFSKTTTGVGANIEHRWSFVAFQKTET